MRVITLALILATFAAMRVTRLVTTDAITMPARAFIVGKLGDHHKISTLVQCNWCSGFWVSLVMVPPAMIWPHLPLLICYAVLAASQVVGLASRLDGGNRGAS